MKEWKFGYLILAHANVDVFKKQCAVLEATLPELKKGKMHQDVDGSDYQEYTFGDAKIEVGNDEYLDHVLVQSDVDLLPYFQISNRKRE
jgi:hypothetical protein